MKQKANYHLLIISLAFVFFFGLGVGGVLQQNKYLNFLKTIKTIRVNYDNEFVNPILGVESEDASNIGIFSDTKKGIEKYISSEKKSGKLYSAAVYFRNLNTSLWFGINEKENFVPASLFKLPVAIAVYGEVKDDPTFLQKHLMYTEQIASINTEDKDEAKSALNIGGFYTVEDLVERMLIYSDNGALDLLVSNLDKKYIEDLFEKIALVNPESRPSYSVNAKDYSLFLRILFSGSYLHKTASNSILKILSKSTFYDGIVGGVPANTKVAHKFGTHRVSFSVSGINKEVQELHDCGIVYIPDNPYLVCIMTKGDTNEDLAKVISNISKMIYDEEISIDE